MFDINNEKLTELQHLSVLTAEIDSLYHETSLTLNCSDSIMTTLYHLLGNNGECGISKLCELGSFPKQTLNSTLRKLEKDELIFLKNSLIYFPFKRFEFKKTHRL